MYLNATRRNRIHPLITFTLGPLDQFDLQSDLFAIVFQNEYFIATDNVFIASLTTDPSDFEMTLKSLYLRTIRTPGKLWRGNQRLSAVVNLGALRTKSIVTNVHGRQVMRSKTVVVGSSLYLTSSFKGLNSLSIFSSSVQVVRDWFKKSFTFVLVTFQGLISRSTQKTQQDTGSSF
jgi:hypothetical protein